MSNELEEKTKEIERVTSMLIAIAVNHLHSTYDNNQKRLRANFFALPASEVFKTWEWLSDNSKLAVLTAKRALFDRVIKDFLEKGEVE
jgi:hypothetical protein